MATCVIFQYGVVGIIWISLWCLFDEYDNTICLTTIKLSMYNTTSVFCCTYAAVWFEIYMFYSCISICNNSNIRVLLGISVGVSVCHSAYLQVRKCWGSHGFESRCCPLTTGSGSIADLSLKAHSQELIWEQIDCHICNQHDFCVPILDQCTWSVYMILYMISVPILVFLRQGVHKNRESYVDHCKNEVLRETPWSWHE